MAVVVLTVTMPATVAFGVGVVVTVVATLNCCF
jgi:hypothetical protein